MPTYETTIGLEIHVELKTKTKIFCSCSSKFGVAPNTQICPVCAGLPGSLPVLNRKAVSCAIAVGLAANCQINRRSCFDRKNYFYPDNPQNYQITQYALPLCHDGWVEVNDKKIRIHEIHLEEDAGKLFHEKAYTTIDYNRSGVPLIEIVTEPDMHSAEETVAFLDKLRLLIQYADASDCKLNEGSMRVDVNLSVAPTGCKELGTRTEMKNLNSFRSVTRAIQNESERQIALLESGGRVEQETRRWDEDQNCSFSMRSKENVTDYRFFAEPDLGVLVVSDAWLSEIQEALPEFREEKEKRYAEEYHLPAYDAQILTGSKRLADVFEETCALGCAPKEVSNWLMGETLRLCKENEIDAQDLCFSPKNLAKLIHMVDNQMINRTVAKEVFAQIFTADIEPEAYVKEQGLAMESNQAALREIAERVLQENAQAAADYRAGKERALKAIVGSVMKETKGKANPSLVQQLVKELLG